MKEQLEPKLKPLPCPFCGKMPIVLPIEPETSGSAWGKVQCINGNCPSNPQVSDRAKIADNRGSGAYKDLAIKAWNKRSYIHSLIVSPVAFLRRNK